VVDPTENVKALNEAGLRHQNELRIMQAAYTEKIAELRATYTEKISDIQAKHAELVGALQAQHVEKDRATEASRLDAIRSVDQQRVSSDAAAAETRATALAAQVALSADVVRNALDAKVSPILEAITALQRAQYETAGGKAQVIETRSAAEDLRPVLDSIERLTKAQYETAGGNTRQAESRQQSNWSTGTIVAALAALVATMTLVLYFSRKPATTTTNLSCSVAAAGMTCVKP